MATPHMEAKAGQVAATVLMPGDPLRAKFIAESFLKDAKLVNEVRGMLAYTGRYKKGRVTVMGSGMGMPSMGIYAYELYSFYKVENIIRIGSAGSYTESLGLYDLLLARGAYSESSFAKVQSGAWDEHCRANCDSNLNHGGKRGNFSRKDCLPWGGDERVADEVLCEKLRQAAAKQGVKLSEGKVHSSDVFYRLGATGSDETPYWKKLHDERGCVAVEMESFALFQTAAALDKSAACLLTISDSFVDGETTTSAQREKGFGQMCKVALEAAVS